MAINMDVGLKGYEFRILIEDSFVDKDTKEKVPYMTMLVEHPDTCEQVRVSVPKDLREQTKGLGIRKAQYVDLLVNVRAGQGYGSAKLIEVQHVYGEDGEVDF